MNKLILISLLLSVAVLSGCGQTPEECYSYEYYDNGYCRNTISHCSFSCQRIKGDPQCLDKCIELYK